MALTAGKEDRSFNAFCNNLLQLRYRNGIVDGYSSRIHYTSEWILQAEDLGLAKEISCSAGSIPLIQEISYMSTHANQYPALASDWEMTKRRDIYSLFASMGKPRCEIWTKIRTYTFCYEWNIQTLP